jgi:hypothetical protein
MKKQFISIVLVLGAALPAAAVHAQAGTVNSTQLRAASYDGRWNGTVKCLYDPGLWPEDECDIGLTFDIQGKDFRVRQTVRSKKGEVTASEISPGRFSFTRLATNAVAVSIEQGRDEDGTWVETWNFVMTLQDANHMVVHWTRVVNNLDIPADKKGSKFSSVAMGILVRNGG